MQLNLRQPQGLQLSSGKEAVPVQASLPLTPSLCPHHSGRKRAVLVLVCPSVTS